MLFAIRLSCVMLLSLAVIPSIANAVSTNEERHALVVPSEHHPALYCSQDGERFTSTTKTVSLEDVLVFRALLTNHQFVELNNRLHHFQLAAENDASLERVLASAYQTLGIGSSTYTPLFEAWVAETPDAYQPYVALGVHYNARAWRVRGDAMYSGLSASQRAGYNVLMPLAVENLEKALVIFPGSTLAVASLVDSLKMLGDDARIQEINRFADAVMPDSFLVNRELAISKLPSWGGGNDELADFVASRLERPTRLEESLTLRGFYWRELGWRERRSMRMRKNYYDHAVFCGESGFFYRARARNFMASIWPDFALNDMLRAVEIYPVSYNNHIELAKALLFADEEHKAKYHFDIATQIDPTRAESQDWNTFAVDSLVAIAQAQLRIDNHTRAFRPLQLALEIAPEHVGAKTAYARAWLAESGPIIAARHAQRILESNPDYYPAVLLWVDIMVADNVPDAATSVLESFLERSPNHTDARFQRARIAFFEGDMRAAWHDYLFACKAQADKACKKLMEIARYIVEAQRSDLFDLLQQPANQ